MVTLPASLDRGGVQEGSFTRAAQRENATQSGLSQHVAAVEAALGVTLFERKPGGVRPTQAGKQYYEHAIQVLRHLPMFARATIAPDLDRSLGHPGAAKGRGAAPLAPLATGPYRSGPLNRQNHERNTLSETRR